MPPAGGDISPADPPQDPCFDTDRRLIVGVRVGNQPWSVLELLRRRAGRLVTRDAILDALPGSPSDRALDVYVWRLRMLLRYTPHRIETVRQAGYIFSTDPARECALVVPTGTDRSRCAKLAALSALAEWAQNLPTITEG